MSSFSFDIDNLFIPLFSELVFNVKGEKEEVWKGENVGQEYCLGRNTLTAPGVGIVGSCSDLFMSWYVYVDLD